MSEHNRAENRQKHKNNKGNHKSNAQGRNENNKRETKRFKYIKLEQDRPSLTRDSGKKAQPKYQHHKRGSSKKKNDAKLKIIPLGGLDAIGKNMTVLECGNDIVLDDAGIMFPDDDHPGIDLILPDYTYVLEHADRLRGIVITHGHEDHTGCLPYLYKDLEKKVPIYGSKMTIGLIEGKFKEHGIKGAQLIEVKPGERIKLGCIEAEFYVVNHSIPGALGIFFTTPAGNVLHTGDFKLDQSAIDGTHTDFAALARFGEIGIDLMMSDSTNANNPNFTKSESEVGIVLHNIIKEAKGRVIIAAFASHIHRMQQICDVAVACNRKVVVTGRSMIQNTDIARKLGYLNIDDRDLVDAYEFSGIPPEKIVVMCTGSQGEPLSALSRIAGGLHKTIEIDEGDTVIISATPVPGNEKAVTRVINLLSKIGADVYDKSRALVHVSGHAGAEELKIVLSIAHPKYFMPVHGEATHLRAHAYLAKRTGIPAENIFICENGESLVLDAYGVRLGEKVQSGVVYVDGLSVGDTSKNVLDDRITLGAQGFAAMSAAVNLKKRKLVTPITIEMRGITGGDDPYIAEELNTAATSVLKRHISQGSSANDLRKICRNTLLTLLWERTKQRPIVIVSILEV